MLTLVLFVGAIIVSGLWIGFGYFLPASLSADGLTTSDHLKMLSEPERIEYLKTIERAALVGDRFNTVSAFFSRLGALFSGIAVWLVFETYRSSRKEFKKLAEASQKGLVMQGLLHFYEYKLEQAKLYEEESAESKNKARADSLVAIKMLPPTITDGDLESVNKKLAKKKEELLEAAKKQKRSASISKKDASEILRNIFVVGEINMGVEFPFLVASPDQDFEGSLEEMEWEAFPDRQNQKTS